MSEIFQKLKRKNSKLSSLNYLLTCSFFRGSGPLKKQNKMTQRVLNKLIFAKSAMNKPPSLAAVYRVRSDEGGPTDQPPRGAIRTKIHNVTQRWWTSLCPKKPPPSKNGNLFPFMEIHENRTNKKNEKLSFYKYYLFS